MARLKCAGMCGNGAQHVSDLSTVAGTGTLIEQMMAARTQMVRMEFLRVVRGGSYLNSAVFLRPPIEGVISPSLQGAAARLFSRTASDFRVQWSF